MREDGAGLVAPVCVFESGERVGGQIGPTRGASVPSALLEEGNEVANLDDSSLMGKRIERPLLSRGNTVPSLAEDLGVYCWLSHNPKQTATTWSGRDEGEHVRPGGPRAVAEASFCLLYTSDAADE